ncbi:MAG: amidohydrolase family protein [Candidatus Lustribacter sp.]|jgi:predicted TIM-barrel fold metal-dependent hydrolase
MTIDRRAFIGGLAVAGAGLSLGARSALSQPAGRIDVHHHFAPPYWLRVTDGISPATSGIWKPWTPQRSLDSMDQGGCQKAIVSITTPGMAFGDNEQTRRLARDANEYAAKMRSDHPGRFGIFAALPFPDVDACLREIAYALDTLKCEGVGMFTSYGKYYLGDNIFFPIFEELNRRKAVLFVHPTSPMCCTNYMAGITDADIEYGTDTTRAIARMVFSGCTVRYPNIKIIWSHAGGTMPYLQWRFMRESRNPAWKSANLPDAFEGEARKMYYDTAQTAIAAPMAAITKMIPVNHLLFGSDYPYLTVKENVDGLATCGVFTPEQLTDIGRANTLAVLGA